MARDAARPDTWMPLYWGDYLKDTMHLRTEAHGAYLLLIGAYWTSGEPLPDDDDHLSAVTKMDEKSWKKMRAKLAPFFVVSDGVWRHERIDRELAKAAGFIEQKSNAGRASAAAREERKAQREGNGTSTEPPTEPQREVKTSPSPSPSKYSDPNGSAPQGGAGDPRIALFGEGLAALKGLTGTTDRQARSLLGKWLKQAGDDASAVVAVIRAARDGPTLAEPVAWIEASFRERKPDGKPTQREARDADKRAMLSALGYPIPGGGHPDPARHQLSQANRPHGSRTQAAVAAIPRRPEPMPGASGGDGVRPLETIPGEVVPDDWGVAGRVPEGGDRTGRASAPEPADGDWSTVRLAALGGGRG